MTFVPPSMGRIVLVGMDPKSNNGVAISPAIVSRVWSDTVINARVLAESNETPWRTSITFVPQLADLGVGNWTWPVLG